MTPEAEEIVNNIERFSYLKTENCIWLIRELIYEIRKLKNKDSITIISKLLLASAYHAWCNILRGNLNTNEKKYFERASHPTLNDYVFEWSSATNCFLPENHKNYRNAIYNVGKLVYIEYQSSIIDKDSNILDSIIDIRKKFNYPDASTIENLNGNLYRWTNHNMILIPNNWKIL
jgi:hypothetical protein